MKLLGYLLLPLCACPTFATGEPGPAPDVAAPIVAPVLPPTQFSFRADNVPIKEALAMFARANKLTIVPDLDIEGQVTVDFHDLPLDLAMGALLEANGYYFVQDGHMTRVRNLETRLFQIDYIRMTRSSQGSNAVQISSGGGGSSGAGGVLAQPMPSR